MGWRAPEQIPKEELMGEQFDRIARSVANGWGRRGFLEGLTAAVAVLVFGDSCKREPTAPNKACTNCCKQYPNYNCCEKSNSCCPADYPHLCPNGTSCYKYFTDAQKACGNNYEICYGCRYV